MVSLHIVKSHLKTLLILAILIAIKDNNVLNPIIIFNKSDPRILIVKKAV